MKKLSMILSSLMLAACGGSGSATPSPGAASDMAASSTLDLAAGSGGNEGASVAITVAVPASLTGTPRQLLVAAFDQFPVTGPPAGVLYQGSPTLTAGHSVMLTGDAGGISGTKYVLAVLYMQGGGQLAPQPGVDYVSGPNAVTFGGGPIDAGTLSLALLPGSDGGI
jgi:hypothetical protein